MIISLILALLENYFLLFPFGFTPSFLILYLVNLIIVLICKSLFGEYYDNDLFNKSCIIDAIAACLLFVLICICAIIGSPLFNASIYHNAITVEKHTEDELIGSIPDISQINTVSLMDTASAEKLGDRTLGTLADLVSQYKVGTYYTITTPDGVRKIAPLEYNGFFKWNSNRSIPGYVMVNPLDNTAEYISLEKPMRYMPSAYFGDDLFRHVRSAYSNYFGDSSFQIDDENNPYWIITTLTPRNIWGNKVPDGAILVNACSGEMHKYDLSEIPEWVDLVVSGDTASDLYNRYGRYINGVFNFSDTGVTQTTDDFGYITINNDVYIYTGITSVSSDESNLGVILVNSRLNTYDYYPIPGAEEYSAMNAAEGIVQNFGYKASFPSLIMIDNNPAYVMVLKDNNGLVKKYAIVNYANYTIAVVEDTLDKCILAYNAALKGETYIEEPSSNIPPITTEIAEGQAIIKRISFVTINNTTYCYINTTDNQILKTTFNESLLSLFEGDIINIKDFTIVE